VKLTKPPTYVAELFARFCVNVTTGSWHVPSTVPNWRSLGLGVELGFELPDGDGCAAFDETMAVGDVTAP